MIGLSYARPQQTLPYSFDENKIGFHVFVYIFILPSIMSTRNDTWEGCYTRSMRVWSEIGMVIIIVCTDD